ncbi:hypothetical protein MLD38_024063 [Melastoma candidum]|uniref:Uncharacterized protein n=1 Tax=Melastoma candidum TaxID=119954 RepID=A0ACB9NS10_9MYRT|nr:hypothetical protein MLD38_024063 [Melastoma candidum]
MGVKSRAFLTPPASPTSVAVITSERKSPILHFVSCSEAHNKPSLHYRLCLTCVDVTEESPPHPSAVQPLAKLVALLFITRTYSTSLSQHSTRQDKFPFQPSCMAKKTLQTAAASLPLSRSITWVLVTTPRPGQHLDLFSFLYSNASWVPNFLMLSEAPM